VRGGGSDDGCRLVIRQIAGLKQFDEVQAGNARKVGGALRGQLLVRLTAGSPLEFATNLLIGPDTL
jgi:hypothetical protein